MLIIVGSWYNTCSTLWLKMCSGSWYSFYRFYQGNGEKKCWLGDNPHFFSHKTTQMHTRYENYWHSYKKLHVCGCTPTHNYTPTQTTHPSKSTCMHTRHQHTKLDTSKHKTTLTPLHLSTGHTGSHSLNLRHLHIHLPPHTFTLRSTQACIHTFYKDSVYSQCSYTQAKELKRFKSESFSWYF